MPMQQENFSLTPEQERELQSLAEMPDEEIDFSDIPRTLDWSGAQRGMFYQASQSLNARPETAASSHTLVFTDTTERGLEARITAILSAERPESDQADSLTWLQGDPAYYDRDNCVDLNQLAAFMNATQPEVAAALSLDNDNPTRRQFLARLKREIRNRGIIDVLRRGISHHQHHVNLFYGTPTRGNATATERYAQNRFSVTRQLRYSNDEKQNALDLVLFINGLPVATFELKNNLTKQTVSDAVQQYRQTRRPSEDLFHVGRCAVHFAVDENEAMFCTKLAGKASVFLPFNKGRDDGAAGNPVNPNGLKTDYLWEEVLTPGSLTDIIENYTQKLDDTQIWPRYHQLEVVRNLLDDAASNGAGKRYLIQHSAGSGKSNSIAWLSRQLIELPNNGQPVFDSIVIVTDRRLLDKQITDTIRQFTQVSSTVGHAETSAHLRQLITEGKKIVTTTVQKFPLIIDAITNEHRGRKFAIIIDEAHSSQGGRTAAAMNVTLGSQADDDDEDTFEDQINRIIENRRLLDNASYFAFTATPKNKTLELFGEPDPQPDGAVKHLPFHSYTMKQAIQEGFILDVLGNHTTVDSYFGLVKKIDDDPEFDSKRAQRRLRRYVEGHQYAVAIKAQIMVDHFHESVFLPRKIDGHARAMVVTDGVDRAIAYHHAISAYITGNGYPYRSIIAFSGDRQHQGQTVNEASLNGFPSTQIPDKIQEDPYRILICADKFQTGYDEPLLHTMYVDKTLAGIKAVQTLSRLNRARPNKSDTFVLDFMNSSDVIRAAFADYYRTTMLANETDPNKLHDLKANLDSHQVYTPQQVDELVEGYLSGKDRGELDPIADTCVAPYQALNENRQVEFKGSAKAFARLYAFLSQILPYPNPEWEKLSIFLNFLIPKLPAPVDEDLSVGILETVNMDSYRTEKQATQRLLIDDEDTEIPPVPAGGGGHRHEPELAPLTQIVATFNETWGTDFTDADKVAELIRTLPDQVVADTAYQNARRNSDPQNARIEHDAALRRLITSMVRTNTELFRAYTENPDFRSWLTDQMFWLTYLDDASA